MTCTDVTTSAIGKGFDAARVPSAANIPCHRIVFSRQEQVGILVGMVQWRQVHAMYKDGETVN